MSVAHAAGSWEPTDPANAGQQVADATWDALHKTYLETHVDLLRIRLRRRVLWLRRHHWRSDPLEELHADVLTDERADRLATKPSADEATFHRDDPDASELTRTLREGQARLADLEAQLEALDGPPPLHRLGESAGLDDIERDALTAALGVALEPSLGPLFGYIQDDPALASPTPAAVAALFGHTPAAAWSLIDPQRPLRRVLLRPSEPATSHELVLDPRTLAHLCGHDTLDSSTSSLVQPLDPLPLAGAHRRIAERIADWMLARPDAAAPLVNLVGGRGRTALAGGVAAVAGCRPLLVNASGLAGTAASELQTALEREALLEPTLFVIDADQVAETQLAVLIEQLERLAVPALVGSATRLGLRRNVLVQRVPDLSASDRAGLWRDAAGISEAEAETLAAQFHLDPAALASAVADARARAALDATGPQTAPDGRGIDGTTLDASRLWDAARELVGRDLGVLAQRIVPVRTLDDLVLPEADRGVLTDLVAQAPHRTTVYRDWGYERLLPRGQGVTVLFTGPPGTGKTLAAEALAGALELDLYRIDLSAVVSKYIGETEKNLRRVFDAAETGAAVLFFDEADALFGKRTEIRDSHDRHANVEVNYLLQRMEDYQGVAVLATNRKGDLDPAFLRRIRTVVSFPFPDLVNRRRIWEAILPEQVPTEDLDLDALARLEIAGGSIRNVALAGAFLAASADEPLGMGHLMIAARREYAKIDKVVTAAEFGLWAVQR